MNCYLMLGLFVLVAASIIWLRERDHRNSVSILRAGFDSTTATLHEQLQTRNQEFESLLDRWYRKNNQPPADVSLSEVYTKQRAVEESRIVERKNGGALESRGIGPVDSAQLKMAIDVRKRAHEEPANAQ